MSSTQTPPSHEQPQQSRLAKLADNLSPFMGAVIGLAVLGLFSYAIWATVQRLGEAPVSADTTTGSDAYSAFDRAVQVVGLISPVLTIVLGFYFGARAGAGDAAVAQREAASAKADTHQLQELIAELQARAPETRSVLQDLSSERSMALPAPAPPPPPAQT